VLKLLAIICESTAVPLDVLAAAMLEAVLPVAGVDVAVTGMTLMSS
jgi:hypothetical protein